ncbi:SO2930 family diheme c-type cytochrome [uncultured Microscilla sp.]|uniref:SO2930 family diheme c-type cytochrome n=1 Tax=uncultured Microscilla sp. TaxID=432653 RepID=UPI0026092F0C|nr:SO2930 family diheme c-type cytochrome [uncultured Microscilla sp.]
MGKTNFPVILYFMYQQMTRKVYLFAFSALVFTLTLGHTLVPRSRGFVNNYPLKLSLYGFFRGKLAELLPAKGVMPYTLNTPLFSDYAQKARFIKLPKGKKASYNAKEVFEFPVGTTLIKNFFYPIDARDPSKGRRLVETRLLIHEANGWKALPYVWNEEQTDAMLEIAGETKQVSWIDKKGQTRKLGYMIPNMNQCKGCHVRGRKMMPIGPSARQLNGNFIYPDKHKKINQLLYWQKTGMLQGLPALSNVPKAPVWNDPSTGDLNARARIWLDINCGHCHRPDGPANTSGLFLYIHEQNMAKLGVYKSPIAAGRAAQYAKYDILPGEPNQSLVITRLEATDPGIRMPELGRQTVHQESLELLKEWIKNIKK